MPKDHELPFAHELQPIAQELAFKALDRSDRTRKLAQLSPEYPQFHVQSSIGELLAFVKEGKKDLSEDLGPTFTALVICDWIKSDSFEFNMVNRIGTLAHMISVNHDFFASEDITEVEQRFLLDIAVQSQIELLEGYLEFEHIKTMYGLQAEPPPTDLKPIKYWKEIQLKLRERVSPSDSPEKE